MLLSTAFAETPINASYQSVGTFAPQILFLTMIGLFYFLVWRPQAQQQKEKQELINSLQKGDVIYTNGGVVGKVTQLHEHFCQIEVATNTRIYVQKAAILDLVPKGSLKSIGFE